MSGQEILKVLPTCEEAIIKYGLEEIGMDGCSPCDKVKFCFSRGTLPNVDVDYLSPQPVPYTLTLTELPRLIDVYPGNDNRNRKFVSIFGGAIAVKGY